jgi:hypothetical protein
MHGIAGDVDLLKRRAQFVRDGIPHELYVERAAWARQARSAALFRALTAGIAWLFGWVSAGQTPEPRTASRRRRRWSTDAG